MITEQYPLPEHPGIKSEEELLTRVEKGMPKASCGCWHRCCSFSPLAGLW